MNNHHHTNTEHCENCGSTDAEDLRGGHGYTSCCNENVCSGGYEYRFGTERTNVKACCWAKAEAKYEAKGLAIPEGSSRLSDRY